MRIEVVMANGLWTIIYLNIPKPSSPLLSSACYKIKLKFDSQIQFSVNFIFCVKSYYNNNKPLNTVNVEGSLPRPPNM